MGFRRVHRFPGHRHAAFPVRRGQLKRLTRHRPQIQIDRNYPPLQVFCRRHLRRVRQPPYGISGFHLRLRPQPQERCFPCRHIRTGVDQIDLVFALAQGQPVAVLQCLFQFHPGHLSVRGYDFPDPDSLVIHRLRTDDARVFAAQGIAFHKPAPVENLQQAFLLFFVRLFKCAALQAVQPLPVTPRHHSHILRPLQPAFQLHRGDTCGLQLRQLIPQAHVPGAQPGAPLSAIAVYHPARLGAPAPIAAPFTQHAGEQAQAAHCHALGAVAEHFDLSAGFRALPDFIQAAFPGQYYAADSLSLAPAYAGPVMDRHLRAGVHCQLRKLLPDDFQHAQVLHQHRVCVKIPQQAQHLRHFFDLRVLHQRVYRDMNPHMAQMGIANSLLQLPAVKVSGACPCAEGGIPQVYRVRAGRVSLHQCLPVSRRGQILHRRFSLFVKKTQKGNCPFRVIRILLRAARRDSTVRRYPPG